MSPLRIVQGHMGHANDTTSEVYAAWAPHPTRGAAWAEQAFGVEEVATHPPRRHSWHQGERI